MKSKTINLFESIQENLNEADIVTSNGEYNLRGDQDGYHIYENDEKVKDLGLITKEQALADFDDYVNSMNESDTTKEDSAAEEPVVNYETAEGIKSGVEKSGGLYQFIYDEWHSLPEEMKMEIALNAVYELNNDAKILEDLAERLQENLKESETDDVAEKIKNLELMDKAVRSLNDGEYVDIWLTNGVPDGASQDDYEDIVTYGGEFDYDYMLDLFKKLIHNATEKSKKGNSSAFYDCPVEAFEFAKQFEPETTNYVEESKENCADCKDCKELKEDTVDNVQAYKNLTTMQSTIQSKTGCTVSIEGGDSQKPVVYIKGNSQQLAKCLPYVDAILDLFKEWGNEAYATYNKDNFVIALK